MKIVYINCSRIPTEKAHGLQIMKMCEAFAASSAEVELWAPKRINHMQEDPFDYYGVRRNFAIKKIPCIDFIQFDAFLGPLALWLTEFTFLFFVSLRLLGKKDFVIYTRDKFVWFFLSWFMRKIFFEAHVGPARILAHALGRAAGTIAINDFLGDAYQKEGRLRDAILVAPDGVDLAEFYIGDSKEECRRKLGLPQNSNIVLYAGHLYPWKGVETLLNVAKFPIPLPSGGLSCLRQTSRRDRPQGDNSQFPNTLFLFVGGTEKDIENYKLKAISNKLKNVLIIGHRPHKEIPYWLKAADVLVLPNSAKYAISKYWTSPMKLFEYMASGVPIVASRLPSIEEVLNEKNALFVEPDNSESLAQGIRYALENDEKMRELARQAFQDVQKYAWSERAKRILEFIRLCA